MGEGSQRRSTGWRKKAMAKGTKNKKPLGKQKKPSKAKAPEAQTQFRDLSLEYFRLADETRAALRRLLQYQKDHPELFPPHWS